MFNICHYWFYIRDPWYFHPFHAACEYLGSFSMADVPKEGKFFDKVQMYPIWNWLLYFICFSYWRNACRIYQRGGFIAILVHYLSQSTIPYQDGSLTGWVSDLEILLFIDKWCISNFGLIVLKQTNQPTEKDVFTVVLDISQWNTIFFASQKLKHTFFNFENKFIGTFELILLYTW